MQDSTPLADSPWFWLLMFSGVALLGVVAIAPKYARRQARTEQRYENRVQTWKTRQGMEPRGEAGEQNGDLADAPADGKGGRMESRSPRATLAPLAVLLVVVMLVAALGLARSRRVQSPLDASSRRPQATT